MNSMRSSSGESGRFCSADAPRFWGASFLFMHIHTRVRILVLSLSFVFAAGLLRAAENASLDDFDERPVPVKAVAPVYPPELLREGVSGLVIVQVEIDASGKVVDRSVTKSSRRDFERPALEAVGKWKFKPAAKHGSPVASRIAIPISFKCEM